MLRTQSSTFLRMAMSRRMLHSSVAALADVRVAEVHDLINRVTVGTGEQTSTFIMDEPHDFPGGHGVGPSPYDMLLSALGACTTMTVRLYARRKQYPLQKVAVTLRHRKVWAKDVQSSCATAAEPSSRIDEIVYAIELVGPELTPEQRADLLRVSAACPVHKTLNNPCTIVSHVEALPPN